MDTSTARFIILLCSETSGGLLNPGRPPVFLTDGDRYSVVTPAIVAVATFVIDSPFGLGIALNISGPADNPVFAGRQVCCQHERPPGVGAQIRPQEASLFPGLATIGGDVDFIQRYGAAEGHAVNHVATGAAGFQR